MLQIWLAAPTPWRREPLLDRRAGRLYPHPDTLAALARWRAAWLASERAHTPGAVEVELEILRRRPDSHWLLNGSLSTKGRRAAFPTGRPDLDNVCKAALDALKGLAFDDDAAVVTLVLSKRWTIGSEPAGATLRVRPARS